MAYWGPPFTDNAEQARLASLAALDMLKLVPPCGRDFAELLGMRTLPNAFDIRIGIATGEALVGSIGSELMMSYTVMGETVNLASRLEGASKEYGSHILASARHCRTLPTIETREIDRRDRAGRTRPQTVFEIMGVKGELTPAQIDSGPASPRASPPIGRSTGRKQDAFAAALHAVPAMGRRRRSSSGSRGWPAAPPGEGWDGFVAT